MKITVRGKGIDVTDALKQYVEKKLGSMEKFFDETEVDAQARLRVESGEHIAELTIRYHSFYVRAEERSDDMYASIDAAADRLQKQYLKHKEKMDKKHRNGGGLRGAVAANAASAVDSEPIEEETAREDLITRRKSFSWKPMSEEEALMQMDLLGHNFFVFTNDQTERVNVVYARNDGTYGIIEPE